MGGEKARSFPPAGKKARAEMEAERQVVEAGRLMCEADGMEDPSLPDVVWALFREGADTLRRLPDRERGWLSSGNRTAWPGIVYDAEDKRQAQEQFDVELARVQSGQDPVEAVRLREGPPDRAAIGRVEVISGWHRYLAGTNRRRDWKILWLLAAGSLSAPKIAKECNCATRTVWNVREWQCRIIAEHLKAVE